MICKNCKNRCDCKEREAFEKLLSLGDADCSGYEPDTMPDKLTDSEIKKALECCAKAKLNDDCRKLKCPFFDDAIDMCGVLNSEQVLIANAFDLINRLQAENERLKANLNIELENFATEYDNKIKAEAYKECIEKVNNIINEIYNKHIFGSNDLLDEEKDAVINFSDDVTYALDNLLKELVGDGK